MAKKDVSEHMIAQPGQSQPERLAPELEVHHADIDESSPEDLFRFIQKLAPNIIYTLPDASTGPNGWEGFFSAYSGASGAETLRHLAETSATPPHIALIQAFLKVHRHAQETLNTITGRHLAFYYEKALGLERRGSRPDRAHLVLGLKKGIASVAVTPEHRFSAGRDNTKVERLYKPTRTTVINTGQIASLRSVFVDRSGRGVVRMAPIANSIEGLGGELPEAEPSWSGFGHEDLPAAELGFALASPTLKMRAGVEGSTRKIALDLTLTQVDPDKLNSSTLSGAFEVFLSGEAGWIGPYAPSASLARTNSEDRLKLVLEVPPEDGAVVGYDDTTHGYAYTTSSPIAQVSLKHGSNRAGYLDFSGVYVKRASITVEASGLAPESLESDFGALDPKKPFFPFGAQPKVGSRFVIACPEAISKKLRSLKLHLTWKDAPSEFSKHYSKYQTDNKISNTFFTTKVIFKDGSGWRPHCSGKQLFDKTDARKPQVLTFERKTSVSKPSVTKSQEVAALQWSGSHLANIQAMKFVLAQPVFLPALKHPTPLFPDASGSALKGKVTLELENHFFHEDYRQNYVTNVLNFTNPNLTLKKIEDSTPQASSPALPKEPYVPVMSHIRLDYEAQTSEVPISTTSLSDFASSDIQFFHLGCFGQRREHGYLREHPATQVPLLPEHPHRGELRIGLSGLKAGDSTSLLFQVAEGSAAPEARDVRVGWSVLCDNHWRALKHSELVLDTTNNLLTSGLVKIVVPQTATATNTMMPPDHIWIRATLDQPVGGVCRLLNVAANAIEVEFADQGNDPAHLESALPSATISKPKISPAQVKSIDQPYASFGGAPREKKRAFNTRVSERLRHKNRCITPWDYERLVLEAFPSIYRVKCIPHAREGVWNAPGHVLLVVIPDLKNKNARDPLRPRVDADTLSRITDFVQARAGMQVKVQVRNPTYEQVQMAFKVRFHRGHDFNHHRAELEKALIHVLSPWASGSTERAYELSFGGRIYRSRVLHFVEEQASVDYVTDFKMYRYWGNSNKTDHRHEVLPETPNAILVSYSSHTIAGIETA